ncbi:MAG TPA: hypothetical protein EYP34_03285 [Chromatiaceae bacterium]|nr:hypothetical protein [Chromatiaceae bacterium]
MSESTEQLFARVLEHYRRPPSSGFDRSIPAVFPAFLECLARPEERLASVADSLGCDVEELWAASCFYIRELLLTDVTDHYRILGLSPDVDSREIRHRYRLLIGLFHPDRSMIREPWEEQFVRRVNRAWGVLKHPQKRLEYDRARRTGNTGQRAAVNRSARPKAARNRSHRVVQPEVAPSEYLYRFGFLQRHPKAVIWLVIVTALVILLLLTSGKTDIGTLTLTEPRMENIGVADKVPESLFLPTAHLNGKNAQPVTAASGFGNAAVSDVSTEGGSFTDPEPVKPVPTQRSTEPRKLASPTGNVVRQPVSTSREALATVSQAVTSTAEKVEPNDVSPAPESIGFDGTLIPPSLSMPGATAPEMPSFMPRDISVPQLQPEFVLMQFVQTVESGDLDDLLSLFVLEPYTNAGAGREVLRNKYAELFAQTHSRTFDVEQVTIRPLSNNAYGMTSRMRLTTKTQDGSQRHFRGEMAFRLIRKGGKLYIASLLHNVTSQAQERFGQ